MLARPPLKALGRRFSDLVLVGLTDVCWVRILPSVSEQTIGLTCSVLSGKIIQGQKCVETENSLVLIDEVDKIGQGSNGDPGLLVCLILFNSFSILALHDPFFRKHG